MLDDFRVRQSNKIMPPEAEPAHEHNLIFVQKSSEFQLVNPGNNRLFEKVEFAYLLCRGCQQVFRKTIQDLKETE